MMAAKTLERDTGERGRTVLICDDERRLATLTALLLERHGYSAVAVSAPAELAVALDRPDLRVDIVLLDVNLAGTTARDIIETLRIRGIRAPVVLTSGYAREDVPPAVLGLPGVAAYVMKPFMVDELAESFDRVLERATAS